MVSGFDGVTMQKGKKAETTFAHTARSTYPITSRCLVFFLSSCSLQGHGIAKAKSAAAVRRLT